MSHRPEGQPDTEVPVEDAVEQNQEIEGPPGEGSYPEDAVGLDGTPIDQLLEERSERLDEDNRDENTSVDNTGRDFDVEKGMYTDDPDYEQAEKKYPPLGEGGA